MIENGLAFKKNGKHKIMAALIALVAVALTVVAVWYPNRGVAPKAPPKEPSQDELLAEAKAGGYKIFTTEELAERSSKDSSLLIVDARHEWEYHTSHIKGAVNFPVERDWRGRIRKTSALINLIGPDKDRTIVFYCGGLA